MTRPKPPKPFSKEIHGVHLVEKNTITHISFLATEQINTNQPFSVAPDGTWIGQLAIGGSGMESLLNGFFTFSH